MSKPVIVLADSDYSEYLSHIEAKFAEEQMNDIDLQVYTDKDYFTKHFSTPQKVDVMLVSEDFYFSDLVKQNIQYLFALTESIPTERDPGSSSVRRINKYATVKKIYSDVVGQCSDVFRRKADGTSKKVIVVTSPYGGAGKTTAALGLSICLAQGYKKVLYIDAEQVQSFQFFLKNRTPLSDKGIQMLGSSGQNMYFAVKPYLKKEQFTYMPAPPMALEAYKINRQKILDLIREAKASSEYDFIIVDTDSALDTFKYLLIELADNVVIVTEQDAFLAFQTKQYTFNLTKNSDKYIYVCNRYDQSSKNYLPEYNEFVPVSVYVKSSVKPISSCADMAGMEDLQKLAEYIS